MAKWCAPEARFWAKVDKVSDPGGCWLWTASKDKNGYGLFWSGTVTVYAHRFAYELLVGPIPKGLTLDHVKARGCAHHHCVRPEHLEPVTNRVNILRGSGLSARRAVQTHCKRGHELAGRNLYVYPNGSRKCRTCHRDWMRESHRKKRAQVG